MGNCQTSLVYWTLYNGFDLSMGRGYLGLLFLIDPGMACIIYIYMSLLRSCHFSAKVLGTHHDVLWSVSCDHL